MKLWLRLQVCGWNEDSEKQRTISKMETLQKKGEASKIRAPC